MLFLFVSLFFSVCLSCVNLTLSTTPASEAYEVNYPASPTVPVQNINQGVIDSNQTHIFYYVQVSYIHINEVDDPQGITNFNEFCNQINSTIKPAFVISSGDNVDDLNQILGDY